MPTVGDLTKMFSNSESSSMDTWNIGRGGDEESTTTGGKPVRYVRDGEFDPEYHDYAIEVEHRPKKSKWRKEPVLLLENETFNRTSHQESQKLIHEERVVANKTVRNGNINDSSDNEYKLTETTSAEQKVDTVDSRHEDSTRGETDMIRDHFVSSSSSEEDESSTLSTEFEEVLEQIEKQVLEDDNDKETSDMSSEFEEVLEQVEKQVLEDEKKREIPNDTETPSVDTSVGGSEEGESSNANNLCLHEIFGEAVSTDDVAWRNGLYMLSLDPTLATVSDNGWTPLHVCCLGSNPPPGFIIRALLRCHSDAVRAHDDGGRLPLHILAASSADTSIMRLLLEEYPQAVYQTDKRGLSPLHMLFRNHDAQLSLERTRLLLGQTIAPRVVPTDRERISMRRGQHLNLSVDQLNKRALSVEMAINPPTLESQSKRFAKYPKDVQECFRRLTQWKQNQGHSTHAVVEEQIEQDDISGKETNPAAIAALQNLQLPLHIAVRRTLMDSSITSSDGDEDALPKEEPRNYCDVLRVLVAAFPGSLSARDDHGRTPLLTALLNKNGLPSQESVELLLGRRTLGYESLPTWAHDIPLHDKTIGGFPNPAMIPTLESHQLPLHVAAFEMASNAAMICAIYDSYPGAVNVQDIRGRTPLHLALRNYQTLPFEPNALSCLLTSRAAATADEDGMLPIDLLIKNATNLPSTEPRTSLESNDRIQPCLSPEIYQKLFVPLTERLLREQNSWKRQQFFEGLRSLPPWLRRHVNASKAVQDLLTEELAGVVSCAMIMFKGMILSGLLITFRLQLVQFVELGAPEGSRVRSWHVPLICMFSSYLLFFQAIWWRTSASLSVLWPQCIFNLWSWLDLGAVSLSIATTFCISFGSTTNKQIASLGTAGTCFLWGSVLGYFATWWYDMAIFVGGVYKIASLLFCPLIAVAILTVAFAQMIYTVDLAASSDDCIESVAGRALCTVRDSYVTVYLLFLGTPLVDTANAEDEGLSTGMVVLIVAFAILLVLLLLNILAIVFTESANLDPNKIALEAYWGGAFTFHCMVGDLTNCFSRSRLKLDDSQRNDGIVLTKRISIGSSALENAWDILLMKITGADTHRSTLWYFGCFGSWEDSRVARLPLRFFSICIVVLWIGAGVVTCGVLWPPQLRNWLFRSARTNRQSDVSPDSLSRQISALRNELFQLKIMSYQKLSTVQSEVLELKDLLVCE